VPIGTPILKGVMLKAALLLRSGNCHMRAVAKGVFFYVW
jgi:hypothetical protein